VAYGDGRSEIASDTFDSSIDGNWSNGDGDWSALSWVTGGHIETASGAGGADASIRRSAGTYANDQYSRTTVQTHQNSASRWISASVRMASGTDESAYVGTAQTDDDRYELYELSASFGFTSLAFTNDPGTEIPHTAGDIITAEVEGTTLRVGSDAGGSDVQKVTTTDNTITSGDPGVAIFTSSGQETQVRATAWSGGDITGLTITDVDTDETWNDGDTGLVITGTGFVT